MESKLFFISPVRIDNPYDYSIFIKLDDYFIKGQLAELNGVRIPSKSSMIFNLPVPSGMRIKQLNLINKRLEVEGIYIMLTDLDF